MLEESRDYRYLNAELNESHGCLLPAVERALASCQKGSKVFDLGCGNGSVANYISGLGYEVVGVDASDEGIALARQQYPNLRLEQGSAYDRLAARYGQFDVVVSLEVVEHMYAPRNYAKTLYDLLRPGGLGIISTPYHGYWKNLAIALAGKMDRHFTALWDGGHIKFWSVETLTGLLQETGMRVESVQKVGRIPAFAKAMVFSVRKP